MDENLDGERPGKTRTGGKSEGQLGGSELLNEEEQQKKGYRDWNDAVDDRRLGDTDARDSTGDGDSGSKGSISHC
jgi:hypothetical protein